MIFTSWEFIAFFLIVSLLYYGYNNNLYRRLLLLLASLLFYSQTNFFNLSLLIFATSANYLFAINIKKWPKLIFCAVLFNTLILVFFKYHHLFSFERNYNGFPIGLSFYTFQSIAYLLDVYKNRIKPEKNIINLGILISFFPKIFAGPIEPPQKFLSQLNKLPMPNKDQIFSSIKAIIYGLFCKIILADKLCGYVDSTLNNIQKGSYPELIIVMILFSFQIFFDFFSYSILAIGFAKLFGIDLSVNFRNPYMSTSIHEFWKRWNITLTDWFRNYIYFPLGGSFKGKSRTYLNVLIIFIISGFWHGSTINYIIWGFLHGLLYIGENHLRNKIRVNAIPKILKQILIFSIISILWIIFKIEDFATTFMFFKQILQFKIVTWTLLSDTSFYVLFIVAIVTIYLQSLDYFENFIYNNEYSKKTLIKEVILINVMIISILLFGSSGGSNFIYFKY